MQFVSNSLVEESCLVRSSYQMDWICMIWISNLLQLDSEIKGETRLMTTYFHEGWLSVWGQGGE